jgi:hypothetical protein
VTGGARVCDADFKMQWGYHHAISVGLYRFQNSKFHGVLVIKAHSKNKLLIRPVLGHRYRPIDIRCMIVISFLIPVLLDSLCTL